MVVPTPRLLLVALAGLIPVALSGSYEAAWIVAGVWLLLTAALAVADGALLPRFDRLDWTRQHEPRLSLGAWNTITLEMRNRSGRSLRVQVRDAVPAVLGARGESGEGVCPAGGTWHLSYEARPARRGDYALGPISARYLGPLGLAWRQHARQLDDRVQVFPNLLAVRSYETLWQRGRLQEMGLHPSRRWGAGTEFERLREYTHDDEFRRINWPATARRHRPITIDFQTERSQNILAVLDCGRLMATRTAEEGVDSIGLGEPELMRLDYAVNAALLLSFAAQQYGDRVGLLAFADSVLRYLPPRSGRGQFLALTEALYNLPAEPVETNFATGLGYLAARNPRRSLAVIFTDILEPEAAQALIAHVVHLVRRHVVLVVTLRDPALDRLAALPPAGSDQVYQRAVALRTRADREESLSILRNRGVLTLDVSAREISLAVINRYLELKSGGLL